MTKPILPDSAFERSLTPQSIREEKLIHDCLSKLFDELAKPKRIVEFFGGIGNITKLVKSKYPSIPRNVRRLYYFS